MKPYLPHLTGLRGLAVLIVFMSHAANRNFLPSVFGNGYGQLGVFIFFVLSGFLMQFLYGNQIIEKEKVKAYVKARVARVVPLYLAIILISAFIKLIFIPDFRYDFTNTSTILKAFFLIDANHELWAIPVEVHFYIIFLFFWYFSAKSSCLVWLMPLVMIIPCLISLYLESTIDRNFLYYGPTFFLGVGIAILYKNNFLKKISVGTSWLAFLLFIFNPPSLNLQFGDLLFDDWRDQIWLDPLNYFLCALFFIGVLNHDQAYGFLKAKILLFFGEISFGFYLMHAPILTYIQDHGNIQNDLLSISVGLVLTTVLATLSFYYFEKPVNKWIRSEVTI